ncbi:MAG: phosphatidylserine decarboxylase family protein [Deltaproteobacteria bacterium]|nr:phosphatidylserine decarboxylase family protein [Deltaproteobacteria bacterium]
MIDKAANKRIHNKLPIAMEGIPFFVAAAIVTFLFYLLGIMPLTILMGIVSLFILFFFRDPDRYHESEVNAILAPADGKVLSVQHLKDNFNPLNEPAVKVSIFMSIFNVHINRVPLSGRVSQIVYHSGRFFAANLDKASEQNEKNTVIMKTDSDKTVVIIQIAGLIARRIACWIKEEDEVEIGQRFGLIRFGSRVELFMPISSRVTIQPGERVKGGETVLGYLS